ncbi:hypothetical protein A9Q99_03005 [Gammaproteobacteria bacterium 45_16_T64]|nr:hypothetical protein A9Q99_03005 [Gammaproteobacteria bacterium 45_16_T64]
MNSSPHTSIAVLFADVAGSTLLYDKLGDHQAESQISGCLSSMIQLVKKNHGVIVKNIGDEILCCFPFANLAATAACSIQESLMQADSDLQVRIGLNFGPTIIKQNDVFGDTVNIAARMVALAKEEQIISTGAFHQAIKNPDLFDFRQLDPLLIKGKNTLTDIYEILWRGEDSELTSFFSAQKVMSQKTEWALRLQHDGASYLINKKRPSISIGRSKSCDAIINSQQASRTHAVISSRWGKAVLRDKSTNGTYITITENNASVSDEIFVHMEEFPLPNSGILSLGCPAKNNADAVIYFDYQ